MSRASERYPRLVRLARLYRRWTSPFGFLASRFIRRSGGMCTGALPLCIDIGAGTAPYTHGISAAFGTTAYVSIDIAPTDATDIVADASKLPISSQVAD